MIQPILFQLPLALVIEQAESVSARIAHLERLRSDYSAQLDGTRPTTLSEEKIRAEIDTCTRRIAQLRAQASQH